MHASRGGGGFEWKRDTESVESSSGGEAGCASGKIFIGRGRTLTPPCTCFLIIFFI